MNYTKGEWRIENKTRIFANHRLITDTGQCPSSITDIRNEDEANANLIAAAPDNYIVNSETLRLYRYLRDHQPDLWNRIIDDCPGVMDHWDKIKQALSKAEGKEV